MPASEGLTHLALFWLKRPNSFEDRALLVKGLETLRAIPQVKTLHIGFPAPTEARDVVDHSWSVSELMTFDSPAEQAAYQPHPLHAAFIERCGHLWERVLVYDIGDS
jgi:Stress responsive A/B Barrel Domain